MRTERTGEQWVRGASLLVVAACLVAVCATAGAVRRAVLNEDGRTGYWVGDRVDLPLEWFRGSGATLLVFLRSECPASQALASLLPQMRHDVPAGVEVMAVVSGRSGDTDVAFAEAAGFERQQIRTVDFESLHLRVVPTLLLIDRNGVVKMERIGAPPQAGQPGLLEGLPGVASGS